jgi:hypothetical protein
MCALSRDCYGRKREYSPLPSVSIMVGGDLFWEWREHGQGTTALSSCSGEHRYALDILNVVECYNIECNDNFYSRSLIIQFLKG